MPDAAFAGVRVQVSMAVNVNPFSLQLWMPPTNPQSSNLQQGSTGDRVANFNTNRPSPPRKGNTSSSMSVSASPKLASAPKLVGIPQAQPDNKDSSSSASGSPPEDSRADIRTGECQISNRTPNRVPRMSGQSYALVKLMPLLCTEQYFSPPWLAPFLSTQGSSSLVTSLLCNNLFFCLSPSRVPSRLDCMLAACSIKWL